MEKTGDGEGRWRQWRWLLFQIQRGGWWKAKKEEEEDEDRMEEEAGERELEEMEMGGRVSKSDLF